MTDGRTTVPETTPEPRYSKPKILLVDLPEDATARLNSAGFNVQVWTLGRPYRMPPQDGYLPVIVQAHLPKRYRTRGYHHRPDLSRILATGRRALSLSRMGKWTGTPKPAGDSSTHVQE